MLGLLLAVLLTSGIFAQGILRTLVFFPVLVSTIGVGFAFEAMMHPTKGVINVALDADRHRRAGLAHQPVAGALSRWRWSTSGRASGLATVIFMAGLVSIPQDYYEAARIDGATRWQLFWRVTVPLVRPATVTVVTLSLIGGPALLRADLGDDAAAGPASPRT